MDTLHDLIEQVEPSKRPIAAGLVTELNFMRTQLVRLRKEVKEKGCTELFVQGKQEIERLTPAFTAYTALVTKYGQLNKQLTALLPDGEAEQGDDMDAFLQELRSLK